MIEVLTALLVLITAFYAWATYRILKANERVVGVMQDELEALNRPYITVTPFIVPGTPLFCLRIANTGRTPAENLHLEMDRDFYKFAEKAEEKNVASFQAFKRAIPMFAPGAELLFDLAQGFKILGSDADPRITPKIFGITATYQFGNKKVTERNTVDLAS